MCKKKKKKLSENINIQPIWATLNTFGLLEHFWSMFKSGRNQAFGKSVISTDCRKHTGQKNNYTFLQTEKKNENKIKK